MYDWSKIMNKKCVVCPLANFLYIYLRILYEFSVITTEHTVASYESSNFTCKFLPVRVGCLKLRPSGIYVGLDVWFYIIIFSNRDL
jgi:hypothetical protein